MMTSVYVKLETAENLIEIYLALHTMLSRFSGIFTEFNFTSATITSPSDKTKGHLHIHASRSKKPFLSKYMSV